MSRDFLVLILRCPECAYRLTKTSNSPSRVVIIAQMLAHLWKVHSVSRVEVEFKPIDHVALPYAATV
jgi:hypothetical protein